MKPQHIWHRSNFWAVFAVASLFLLFLAAGVWQMYRAHYKERLQAELGQRGGQAALVISAALLDATASNLRRVQAQGTWLAEKTILLDNKVRDGVVGYEVLSPLHIAPDTYVLVNRGWIKAPLLRSEMPQITTPVQSVTLSGIARVPSQRFIELDAQNISGMVWQNLTMERYAAWSGLKLQPFVIYQDEGRDGLAPVLPAPEAAAINADRHRGYAVTWFGLAAVTIVLGLLTWRRSKVKSQ